MKTLYIPVHDLRKVNQHLPELENKIKNHKKILITSTTQFSNQAKEIIKLLKNHELIHQESVLGCTKAFPEADATVIITTGKFHALNIAVRTGKPTFILSPEGVSEVTSEEIRTYQQKQAIRVSKVLEAKIIGVIASTKQGQNKTVIAQEIIKKLRNQGKKAYLFIANELSPLQLNDYPINAWINTACPRIIEDDFEKPIVNYDEIINQL